MLAALILPVRVGSGRRRDLRIALGSRAPGSATRRARCFRTGIHGNRRWQDVERDPLLTSRILCLRFARLKLGTLAPRPALRPIFGLPGFSLPSFSLYAFGLRALDLNALGLTALGLVPFVWTVLALTRLRTARLPTLVLTTLVLPTLALTTIRPTFAVARLVSSAPVSIERFVVVRLVVVPIITVRAGQSFVLIFVLVGHEVVALAPLFLETRAAFVEDAEIMVGELQIVFGLHAIAGKLRIARKRFILLVQLSRVAALSVILAIARIGNIVRRTLSAATAAPAPVLTIVDQTLNPRLVVVFSHSIGQARPGRKNCVTPKAGGRSAAPASSRQERPETPEQSGVTTVCLTR